MQLHVSRLDCSLVVCGSQSVLWHKFTVKCMPEKVGSVYHCQNYQSKRALCYMYNFLPPIGSLCVGDTGVELN